MNRKQRRAEINRLQKSGIKRAEAIKVVETYYSVKALEEGKRVKLNYEIMIRHPDWKNQRDDFKDWVTAHKDEVFTVEYDKTKKEKKANDMKTMVCLKEDTTDPKWLFHASCLTEIATGRIKLNDGKEVKFDIADSSSDEKINKAVQEALDRENLKTAK